MEGRGKRSLRSLGEALRWGKRRRRRLRERNNINGPRDVSAVREAARSGTLHSEITDVLPLPQAASPPLPPAQRFPQRAQRALPSSPVA